VSSLPEVIHGIVRHYRNDRRFLVVLVGASLATATAEAGSLIALAPLLQATAEGRDVYIGTVAGLTVEFTLATLAAIAACFVLATLALTMLASYATARVVASHQRRRRRELVRAYLDADLHAQEAAPDGNLLGIALDFVNQSASGLRDVAMVVRLATGVLVFAAGALVISWQSTLVIGVVALGIYALQRPIRRLGKMWARRYSRHSLRLSEEISVIDTHAREIDVFAAQDAVAAVLDEVVDRQHHARVRSDFFTALPSIVFRSSGLLLIIGLIAFVSTTRTMEVAALGVVVLLLYRSLTFTQNLVSVNSKLIALVPVLEQLDDEQNRLDAARCETGDHELREAATLELVDVTFCYPETPTHAVHRVSIDVKRGEVIGVVGPSGAGKSTLAEIAVGIRRPDRGSVLLDGVPLDRLHPYSRRRCISLVSQHVGVIPGTVAQNVDYFRALGEDTIRAALRQAGLDDVVAALAEGVHTPIGSGERSLSGGQVQRLGVARALAGKPSFLILDEPTSSLDHVAEEVIIDTIGRLRGDVGIILIAHRLSTLRHCDRVVVMADGRIVDHGTFDDLRGRNAYIAAAVARGTFDPTPGSGHTESAETQSADGPDSARSTDSALT
jgi:ABC-type multidrug transport system fused ATPase/permease subunit